jgi:outer membrane receptor for ferrienterochelin and colicins
MTIRQLPSTLLILKFTALLHKMKSHFRKTSALLGLRYDYNSAHGSIVTPRFAFKYKPTTNDILRLNFGTGFRVVNLLLKTIKHYLEQVKLTSLEPETS